MAQNSAVVTGGVAISTATLMPAVEWALGVMFHVPVPPSVSSLVAGVLVAGVHASINAVKAHTQTKADR
jgi:small basic protein